MKPSTKNRGRTTGMPKLLPKPLPLSLTASLVPHRLWGIALAVLLGLLLLAPKAARGGEIAVLGGYGVLGSKSPFTKLSLSFGKRVAFNFNGGVVFAKPDTLSFVEFSQTSSVQEKIQDIKIPTASQLYSVGLEIRVLIRKFGKKNNVYLGAGADWLPQLKTYYPGVRAVTGYQLSLLRKRNLTMRFGIEYYLYGVAPANTLALTTSLGYRF